MKLYIYNQNCVGAGATVPERVLEQHENPDEGGDWTVYEGTEDELIDLARSYAKSAKTAGAGDDRYQRRVAHTILEALLWNQWRIDRFIDHDGADVLVCSECGRVLPDETTEGHAPVPTNERNDLLCDDCRPTFTRQQIAFVADKILSAALDRIEACIPDTIPLAEYQEHRESIDHAISMAMDTAGMALAILFAQTTGEGMGVWDWAGSEEFRDTCARFVQERTAPDWPGLKPGDKCYPDTKRFAEMFADEWQEARADVPALD